jgi:type I restriction enzyme S subunit
MESNWQEYSLSEIIELVIDNRGRNPSCYSNVGIPVIDNYLITSEGEPELSHVKRYIDNDIYNTFIRKYNQPGDVLLTLVGNGYGKVAISPKEQCIIIQNTIGLRTKSGFDNHFLYYILKGNRTSLTNLNRGAAQPSIKVGDILNLCFYFPSYEQQITIGNTLYQLDQKIRLNRQTNQTLQQMAQTLFKSWFVDFDPVFDNALAAGTNVSDFPEALQQRALLRQERRKQVQQLAAAETKSKQLPEDILALFPSEFEQTDEPSIGIKGWIPKGWSVGKMNQHAIIEMGQSPKGDTYNSEGVGTPLVNGPVEFGPYFTKKTKWTTAPTKLSKQSDLIVCVRGSTTGRFVKSNGIYCLGRGVCSVRGVRSQVFTDEIFKNSIKTLLGLATGSTFPNWSRQILNEFKVIQPQSNVIDAFNNLISPNVQKAELNVIESEYLSELRDILLPKLISGELTIPDSMKTENIVNHQQPKESLSHHA